MKKTLGNKLLHNIITSNFFKRIHFRIKCIGLMEIDGKINSHPT